MQCFKFSLVVCAFALGLTVTVRAEDNAAQAAARAALEAQMGKFNNVPTNAVVATPAPVAKPVVVMVPVAVTSTNDNAAQAAARAEVAKTVVVTTTVTAATATTTNTVSVVPVLTTKETKLQALNAQYKANLIAPLDYFTQREAILNGK